MTVERDIDYEALAQDAMRGVVRTVLMRVAKSGLPGEHHFYIAFNTGAPGVSLSKRLKQKYPEEMTVVLQHRFWDLIVNDEQFEVKLTFDGIAERLCVPYAAIKVFFDPSVPYGLQFEEADASGSPEHAAASADGQRDAASDAGGGSNDDAVASRGRSEKKPRAARKQPSEKPTESGAAADKTKASAASQPVEPGPAANETKVVKLDAFRKK